MKKNYLLIWIIGIFLLTGCSKTLVCTKDMSSEMEGQGTMGLEARLDYDSKGESLEKVTMTMTIDITSDAFDENELKSFEQSFALICKKYGKEVSSCEVTRKKKTITLVAEGDKNSLNILDAYEMEEDIPNYDKAKEKMKDSGYRCR